MNQKYIDAFNKLADPTKKMVTNESLIPLVQECGFTVDKQMNAFIIEEFKFKKWISQEDLKRITDRFDKKHKNGDELKAKLKLLFDDGNGNIETKNLNQMMIILGVQQTDLDEIYEKQNIKGQAQINIDSFVKGFNDFLYVD